LCRSARIARRFREQRPLCDNRRVDADRLATIDLFRTLSKRELEQVARLADEVDVAEGTVLGREGDIAYEFFVIEDGVAAVEVDGKHVVDLGPGEWFGEIGLLTTERRTATVTAKTPMRLAVFFGPNFRRLARELPQVAATIEAEIGERLARA
jgi:cAMP-dependent protein kinase regulator/CRP/FNR family cyclic AMP-dependent transcriptional regulator/cGMP-dependent protein kinase 2